MRIFKKKLTPYQKALKRMEEETNRAIAHVHNLENLYLKLTKKSQTKKR